MYLPPFRIKNSKVQNWMSIGSPILDGTKIDNKSNKSNKSIDFPIQLILFWNSFFTFKKKTIQTLLFHMEEQILIR